MKLKIIKFVVYASVLPLMLSCGGPLPVNSDRITFVPVGGLVDASINVNSIFSWKNEIYLSIDGQEPDSSSINYMQISQQASATTPYQTLQLNIPSSPSYLVVGDMAVNPEDGTLFLPVAVQSGGIDTYSWLKYSTGSSNPQANSIGSFSVADELGDGSSTEFAIKSADFEDGVVYGNFSDNLVGYNEITGQEEFNMPDFQPAPPDSFWIEGRNLYYTSIDEDSVEVESLDTGVITQIGESFEQLAQHSNIFATPAFALFEGYVYIVATSVDKSNPSAPEDYLEICYVPENAPSTYPWHCDKNTYPLAVNEQIVAFDISSVTSNMLVMLSGSSGSQLYEAPINPGTNNLNY